MVGLGSISVGPSDLYKDLGPITLKEEDDTIWLDVTQTSPTEDWKYSYGIVSFVSTNGAELGSAKVYGNQNGEVFRLGVRRAPSVRTGVIRFRPRAWNLQWVSAKGAPRWELSFSYETGKTTFSSGDAVSSAVAGVLADIGDAGVRWVIKAGIAYLSIAP